MPGPNRLWRALAFHFWRHHFWPKLASFIINFCRRRRSFEWCPDQSDGLNGTLAMYKNAQRVQRKTQTKICCHHTWLLYAGKSCPSGWRFLKSFLTASKPSRRSITSAKRKEKEKKERRKKLQKAHARVQMSQNARKKAKLSWCKCIFDQIKANLAEIQPKNQQNVQETPFSQKAPIVNGLRQKWLQQQRTWYWSGTKQLDSGEFTLSTTF